MCGHRREERNRRRLHYCGVCKTMGRLYGQKSRFLLNNDAVFLAELLSLLGPDSLAPEGWSRAFQSYNCLSLPGEPEEAPLPLRIAASATLLMSEFKAADQVADGGGTGWRLALRVYSRPFLEASVWLEEHGFPVEEIRGWYRRQEEREREALQGGFRSPWECVERVAEPTARVTGLVFSHGARLVGSTEAVQAAMDALGEAFGRLIYLLDACDDYAKDVRAGEFNALRAAFGGTELCLPPVRIAEATAQIERLAGEIKSALAGLPLDARAITLFQARLDANLAAHRGMPAPANFCHAPERRPVADSRRAGWRDRAQIALQRASALTADYRADCPGAWSGLQAPLVFCAVFLLVFLFPRQAIEAGSYRACLELPCSLLFLGSVVRSMAELLSRLTPGLRPAPAGAGVGYASSHISSRPTHTVVVRKQRRPVCGCACDECDCCCCACEGCNCCASGGECCCNGCECASGGECCSGCDCCATA